MKTEIIINNSADPAVNYIGWAPVAGQIRLVDPGTATQPVKVVLKNLDPTGGGQVVFYADRSGTGKDELKLTLPLGGDPVEFFVGGKFGSPSTRDRDASIASVLATSGDMLGSLALMVRIRKDAETLTADERNDFISAIAEFNGGGAGRYMDFRNVHRGGGIDEAHSEAGFLPWHRAFLLDLERELQQLNPAVSLPYWRFDTPAPKLFTRAFIGITSSTVGGLVDVDPSNPLNQWKTDGLPGILRGPRDPALPPLAPIRTEAQTLNLGLVGALYREVFFVGGEPRVRGFSSMEGNPHGTAHSGFSGFLPGLNLAARDPLFFLLHANVDRLWAKWQWVFERFDSSLTQTYTYPGLATDPGAVRIGHNLQDTMWPWNKSIVPPRPTTPAPGGDFPASLLTAAPGLSPKVDQLIDYQGVRSAAHRLGFDYDDVPFEFR